jgi:hypothetical protein
MQLRTGGHKPHPRGSAFVIYSWAGYSGGRACAPLVKPGPWPAPAKELGWLPGGVAAVEAPRLGCLLGSCSVKLRVLIILTSSSMSILVEVRLWDCGRVPASSFLPYFPPGRPLSTYALLLSAWL